MKPLTDPRGKSSSESERVTESEMKGSASPAQLQPASSSQRESSSLKSSPSQSAKLYNRDHFLNRFNAKESSSTVSSPSNTEKSREPLAAPVEPVTIAKASADSIENALKSFIKPTTTTTTTIAVKKEGLSGAPSTQATSSIASEMTLRRLDSSTTRLQAMLKLQVSMEEATKNVVELGQTLLRCQQSWSEIIRGPVTYSIIVFFFFAYGVLLILSVMHCF